MSDKPANADVPTITFGDASPSTPPAPSRDDPPTLPAGERIGHYTVAERLGLGGFGEVYRASHEQIGREVAIKVLHARHSRDKTAVARFIAEAKASNTIGHPNIVEIFDFGVLRDGRHYYVMELLRGQSLKALLAARKVLPLAEARPIFDAVAQAIDAAHAAGLAHRDLKPDNVFLCSDGRVKVIDFGLVKLVGDLSTDLTETGVISGTPRYMSPEQFRGKDIGLATDVYSFGAVLYHVLTGQPPFVAPDAVSVGVMHVTGHPRSGAFRSCRSLRSRSRSRACWHTRCGRPAPIRRRRRLHRPRPSSRRSSRSPPR